MANTFKRFDLLMPAELWEQLTSYLAQRRVQGTDIERVKPTTIINLALRQWLARKNQARQARSAGGDS